MSTHSNNSFEKIVNSIEEKKLLKKLDLRIIPLVTLLYTLSFLDRVNIGNAKLAHLERDLNLVGNEYNWSLGIFFIGYVIFEVPSNIALIKIRPSIWISTLMLIWGIIMTCMAFAKNFSQLMVIRFLLGAFESGLFPGVVFYLTRWYKKSEQSYRIGLFFSGATIAGAFNGLLAFAITNLDSKYGLNGWQWLFIIDGLATVIVALFAYFLISDSVETVSWLTEDERKLAIDRLKLDAGDAHATHFDKVEIIKAFKDVVIIRSPYLIFSMLVAVIGYSLLVAQSTSIALKYTGACVVGLGAFASIPTSIAWLTNNLAGDSKRAVGCAMMIAWGNIGGVVSAQLYTANEAPDYKSGHSIALSLLLIGVILSIIQYYYLKRANKLKLNDPNKFLNELSEEEVKHLGDMHPSFIYSL
ncbi:11786_t:CDS:2 [Scutellospora calospora]|uniref:11786_t:CDS:1 n=1 Tax=Scutellospora calospora TaxID=85575 RepID=A0ACA9K9F4_9GLOM|nr:11786_t:CDS:2 [Scutellospora calospora]